MTGQSTHEIERTDDGIEVMIEARFGDAIEGWAESREDLGLNRHGEPVAGVELVHEEPHFYNDGYEDPHGHGPVTLRFPDIESVKQARDHLYEKATERFEWGADGDAVHSFLNMMPTKFEVEQSLQTDTDHTEGGQ